MLASFGPRHGFGVLDQDDDAISVTGVPIPSGL
jgi:hypothetical protein